MEIKLLFKEKVTLNFINKRDDSYHQNIDELFLQQEIGEYFEF